jgi:hypothetical protein
MRVPTASPPEEPHAPVSPVASVPPGAPAAPPPSRSHRLVRERRPALGRFALALAVVMVGVEAVALAIDGPERYLAATILALIADALSAAAVIVGIVALARRRRVLAATLGIAVAVLGNPLVLLYGLGALA